MFGMIFKKNKATIDQICKEAEAIISLGKKADHVFTELLREITYQTLSESFKKIHTNNVIKPLGKELVGLAEGVVAFLSKNENLLSKPAKPLS